MHVRRPPCIYVVLPWVRAWLDGHEPVASIGVGAAPPRPGEVRVERRLMVVDGVRIPARGIRLPNLHERFPDRLPVAVEHTAAHDDPLSNRLASVLAGEVRILRPDRYASKRRPRDVMEPLVRKAHRRPPRRSQNARPVIGVQVWRLEAGRVDCPHDLTLAATSASRPRAALGWRKYPTGNRRRSNLSVTMPHTPRGTHIATRTATEPRMIRYQAPRSASVCWSRKKISVPTIGPSIEPNPPMRATKIMYADHWTLKTEVG